MLNLSTVSRLAFSAPETSGASPAPATLPAKPAKPARGGKAAKAAKPVSGADKKALAPFIRENRNLSRDAVTVTRAATNFGEITDRDAAYRLFFGAVMRGKNHSATLREIFDAGRKADGKSYNPHYAGSAKATDAGAINRAVKAGYFTVSENGSRLTATAKAKADKHYNGKPE